MRLSVKVHAKARKNAVAVREDGSSAVVSVTAAAHKGKANEAVTELLSRYFHKPKSKIVLLKGEKAREKIFEIL